MLLPLHTLTDGFSFTASSLTVSGTELVTVTTENDILYRFLTGQGTGWVLVLAGPAATKVAGSDAGALWFLDMKGGVSMANLAFNTIKKDSSGLVATDISIGSDSVYIIRGSGVICSRGITASLDAKDAWTCQSNGDALRVAAAPSYLYYVNSTGSLKGTPLPFTAASVFYETGFSVKGVMAVDQAMGNVYADNGAGAVALVCSGNCAITATAAPSSPTAAPLSALTASTVPSLTTPGVSVSGSSNADAVAGTTSPVTSNNNAGSTTTSLALIVSLPIAGIIILALIIALVCVLRQQRRNRDFSHAKAPPPPQQQLPEMPYQQQHLLQQHPEQLLHQHQPEQPYQQQVLSVQSQPTPPVRGASTMRSNPPPLGPITASGSEKGLFANTAKADEPPVYDFVMEGGKLGAKTTDDEPVMGVAKTEGISTF
ncbi:hypothetical protein HK101_000336 [Irineochytrium annulatum]|nr:hypothetical protein HK101_000336 [Irineochytrium annulatum]